MNEMTGHLVTRSRVEVDTEPALTSEIAGFDAGMWMAELVGAEHVKSMAELSESRRNPSPIPLLLLPLLMSLSASLNHLERMPTCDRSVHSRRPIRSTPDSRAGQNRRTPMTVHRLPFRRQSSSPS
jgi:hypothetical protein